MIAKNPRIELPRVLSLARGSDCLLRIPRTCEGDRDTVVACHIRLPGTGVGRKPHDFAVVYACRCCHAVLDDRSRWAAAGLGHSDILRAMIDTLEIAFDRGAIVKGRG